MRALFTVGCAYYAYAEPAARAPMLMGICVGSLAGQALGDHERIALVAACHVVTLVLAANPQLRPTGSAGLKVAHCIGGIVLGLGY